MMAVYCGVCAIRIGSAPENEGSFQTTGRDFVAGTWAKVVSPKSTTRAMRVRLSCAPR